MRILVFLLISAVAVSPLRAAPPVEASFDCAMAALPSEEAICASPRLASLDRIVADDYRNAHRMLERWSTKQEADGIQAEQKKWLDSRNACGSDSGCLKRSMEARRNELESRSGSNWLGALRRVASRFPAGQSEFHARSTDGKLRFFSKAELDLYEHPETERSRKRADVFKMSKHGADPLEVSDCAGYLDARAQGYAPGPPPDACGAGDRKASQFDACELTWLMKRADKPNSSAIVESTLPADLWIFFNGGKSAFRDAGEMGKPSIHGLGYTSVRSAGKPSPESSVAKVAVTPIAAADFNGDGVEDVLVEIETSGKEDCRRYQLLSRANSSEELRPISEPCGGAKACVPRSLH